MTRKLALRWLLCAFLLTESATFAAFPSPRRSPGQWKGWACAAGLVAVAGYWWESTAPPWKTNEPAIAEWRYKEVFGTLPRPAIAGYGTAGHPPPAKVMATLERWDPTLASQVRRGVDASVIGVEWKGEIAGIVSLRRLTEGDESFPTKRHHDVVLQRVLLAEWLPDTERQAVAVSLLLAAQSHAVASDTQTLWVRIDRSWRYDDPSTEAIFLAAFRFVVKEPSGEEVWRFTRKFEERRDVPAELPVLLWSQSGTRDVKITEER